MEILKLENENHITEATRLLEKIFPHAYSDCAEFEIQQCLDVDRIALVAIENGDVVGIVGAIPQYDKTGWELHPLAVIENMQGKGIGSALVYALENKIADMGGVTIYLGTDDEFNKTSLSGCELFDNTFDKIKNVKNIRKHPYEFYQKLGYKIVGVIPDANGLGKPDIWMAKKVNYFIRPLNKEHIKDALSLVWNVFLEFEAPDYCDEGIQEFKNYIEYNSIIDKISSRDLLLWGCFDRDKIIGVIATRSPCHISMLFVDKEHHKKGIARLLFNTALDYYTNNTDQVEFTVNSSPYAIEIYHRLGFVDTDKEQLLNGIRFTPMKYLIR